MRKVEEKQMEMGEIHISKIEFDLRSRDEIPKLLRGLQHIYCTPEIKEAVFAVLEKIVPKEKDPGNGRPGMNLWKILVLGTLRLNCNWDYDKLVEISNEHKTLRLMLQHPEDDDSRYALQTLKDNVSLLTLEVLDKINTIVVKAGHEAAGKKKDEDLKGRSDSFVVETDVHFPTDISLLFDAVRKIIELIARIMGITGWRQSKKAVKKMKRLYTKVQRMKKSNSKNPEKKKKKEEEIKKAHKEYIREAQRIINKAQADMDTLFGPQEPAGDDPLPKIKKFMTYGQLLIDQIRRRVICGESIPHEEKIFSVFEDYTEWISKGKAGVPQELGLKVCILEDQYQFILHHKVMRKQTDEEVAVEMVAAAMEKHPSLNGCSFDKGFHSPANQKQLAEIIDNVILPRKGKLSGKDAEIEKSGVFVQNRRTHAAVESAINAVENHGLDRCLDVGLKGFERYIALAIVARNLQRLGDILQQKEIKSRARRKKYNQTLAAKKRAAA